MDLTKTLLVVNEGDYQYTGYDTYDYVSGQLTKVEKAEWQNQEVKFAAYIKGKEWNKQPVTYW